MTQQLSDNIVKRQAVLNVSTMSTTPSPLLGCRRNSEHAFGELELKVLGQQVRDFMLHGKRQPQSLAGSDIIWRLWVFEFQAQLNPLPGVLVSDGHTVAERLDCDMCIAEQAEFSESEEQRPTECVVHIVSGATADDREFGQKEDVCGPGDRPSWHGASA